MSPAAAVAAAPASTVTTPATALAWLVAEQAHGTDTASILASVEALGPREPAATALLLRALADACTDVGDHRVAADAIYQLARLRVRSGDPAGALPIIDEAAAAYSRAGLPVATLRTALGRMHALDDLGRHADAVASGEATLRRIDELEEVARQSDEARWVRAATLGNLGVAYGFTGCHLEAIAAYDGCADAWSALGLADEQAVADANRAIELTELGRAREALAGFDRASLVFEADDDRLFWAKCLGHRAEAELALGRLGAALRDVGAARDRLVAVGAATEAARLGLVAARVLLGLDLLEECLGELDGVRAATGAAGLEHDVAAASLLQGLAAGRLGRVADAEAFLTEAVARLDAVGDRSAAALAGLALGGFSGCAEPVHVAHEAAIANGWDVHRILALVALVDLGETVEDTALAWASERADQLGLRSLRAAVALRRADRARRRGALDAAIDLYRSAHDLGQSLRGELQHEWLRLAFEGGRRRCLDGLVTTLLDRGAPDDVAEALRRADHDRAPTFVDRRCGRVDGPAAATGDEQLRADLSAAYSKLLTPGLTAPRAAAVREEVRRVDRALALLELRSLPAAAPPPAPATPVELPTRAAGVIFHLTDAELLTFVADGGTVTAHRQPRLPLDQLLDRLAADTRPGGSTKPARTARAEQTLDQLGAALLGELDLQPGADLEIVPDQRLHAVPFEVLRGGADLSRQDPPPTRVVPSLAAAGRLAAPRWRDRPPLVVGVGDRTLSHLPSEAAAVAAHWPDATVLTGASATVASVAGACTGAGVIHMACHGLHPNGTHRRSGLALHDGWLTADQLGALPLEGALLVLSVCETGRLAGPEPFGLAHAALGAGASTCIVSLWPVEDRATAVLMTTLHRHLAAGRSPGAALREARAATRQTWPHPASWAPFAVFGRSE